MGRIGLKDIIYFEVATTISLFLGLAIVNMFQPGAGLSMPIGADTSAAAAMAREDEVRQRWQNLEIQLGEVVDERFAVSNRAFARLLKPIIVLDGRHRT